MSNRVNRALANAYLQADQAASERAFKEEQKILIEEWNAALDDAEAELDAYEKDRGMWEDIGSGVGAVGGALIGFYLGGPKGAIDGAMKGYAVGDDLAMIGFGLDSYHMDKALSETDAVKNFDPKFSQQASKYKYIREGGIEKFEEAIDKGQEDFDTDIDLFREEYDKTAAELIIDEGIDAYTGWMQADSTFDLMSSNLTKAADSELGKFFGADDFQEWGIDLQNQWELGELGFDSIMPDVLGTVSNVSDSVGDAWDYLNDFSDEIWDAVRKPGKLKGYSS